MSAEVLKDNGRLGLEEAPVTDVACDEREGTSEDTTPGTGTQLTSMLNLGATCMGVGILSLPQAFAYMGWALGIALTVFTAVISDLSLQFLVDVSRHSGENTFEGNAKHYLGLTGKCSINVSLILVIFMAQVAFVVVVKTLIPDLIQQVVGTSQDVWYTDPVLLTVITLIIIFPVCLLKTLTALRYTSTWVIVSVLYVFLMIVARFIGSGLEIHRTVVAVNDDIMLILCGMSMILSALLCQFQIFGLDAELRPGDRHHIRRVIHLAMVIPTVIYTFTGLSGYFLFGKDVNNDFLVDFGNSPWATAAKFMLAVANICKLPLHTNPFRVCLGEILPSRVPRNTFVETLLVLAATLGMALVMQSLSKTLALLGCTCGVMIGLVLPGAMHARMHGRGPDGARALVEPAPCRGDEIPLRPFSGAAALCASWSMAGGGCLFSILGVISTITEWQAFK